MHKLTFAERRDSVSSKSSSRSSSSSSSSHSELEEDVDRNTVTHIVFEDKKKIGVVGLPADEDTKTEKTETDRDSVSDIRKVQKQFK